MRAAFGDSSVLHDQNLIGILHRRQAVCDGDNGFAARQFGRPVE